MRLLVHSLWFVIFLYTNVSKNFIDAEQYILKYVTKLNHIQRAMILTTQLRKTESLEMYEELKVRHL